MQYIVFYTEIPFGFRPQLRQMKTDCFIDLLLEKVCICSRVSHLNLNMLLQFLVKFVNLDTVHLHSKHTVVAWVQLRKTFRFGLVLNTVFARSELCAHHYASDTL